MSRRAGAAVAALVTIGAVAWSPHPVASDGGASTDHEVWLLDQSNSPGLAYGGTLYVYDGADLRHDAAAATPERIDLGGATAARLLFATLDGNALGRQDLLCAFLGHCGQR